jgi:hypothetical protein
MKFKLNGGKILEDMFLRLKKIVKKETLIVEKDKDKQFCNGRTIRIDKNLLT